MSEREALDAQSQLYAKYLGKFIGTAEAAEEWHAVHSTAGPCEQDAIYTRKLIAIVQEFRRDELLLKSKLPGMLQ